MNDGLVASWKRGRTRLATTAAKDATEYLPTWQVGQEQGAPATIRTYAEDGYSRNSLIYSCIREKATSFAALTPQVKRADGTIAAKHRMVRLLMDPNTHQDGQEFAELMMTQYEAAGNVYVRKVPLSSDARRRVDFAGFPVQELELIRPDYVSIVPGPVREADVFKVTVAGQVMARIPRAEMIHIHEPHLLNDFYGLSKIALLQREGAIDLQMSDFELSFFRNAGVPMGLLSVKGSTSPEEAEEIKGAFRRAYNGVRKWFDLLVLNSDETSYTRLGIPQNEMEMEGTRFHVESRTCTVFGVPGIIVGARYAMGSGGQTPIEEAEHQFWAETMVPAAMRFARAWGKHLLPEFAVGADRGAQVTYDFTVVRALQEDRSRKLREVVRMVLTGGFTVNQALSVVGMDPLDGGDFYVRNGNQVVVQADGTITHMAPGAAPGANPANPLEGAAALQLEQVLTRAGAH